MRKFLFTMGAAVCTTVAVAQETAEYNFSVFDNYSLLDIANKQTAAATIQKAGVSFPGFMVATNKLTGYAQDIFGKTLNVPGNTVADKADYLLNHQLKDLGITGSDWKKISETNAPHASFAFYQQYVNGHQVVFARLNFRFTPSGQLQRIMMDNYGQPDASASPKLDKNAILLTTALTTNLGAMDVSTKTVDDNWVWFPVPGNAGYQLKAAWHFNVWGNDRNSNMPVQLDGYVDAENGQLLYCKNDVKEDVGFQVKGTVYKDNFVSPATNEPLPNLLVTIGANTYYTNDTGGIVATAITSPVQSTLSLQGKWSTVLLPTTPKTPVDTYNIGHNIDSFLFDGTVVSTIGQVNAYYHVNRVHDYVKRMLPTITGIDISLPTNVQVANALGCNAFYASNTINFYAENVSCNDFSLIGDIVYHEYGHFATDKLYRQLTNNGMQNGGLNEGNSDVWAMSITHDPVLGQKAYKAGGNIRTYNSAAKVYPLDITSEVHANGEVIAGAWWDVGVNIGSADTMSQIFAKTYYDTPDGPQGTEGDVFHQVLVSALINDDNDADLSNGTPHYNEIIKGFARHGIYLFGAANLDHKELSHQDPGQPISVAANLATTTAQKDGPLFQGLKLVYRNRTVGTWDTLAMNNGGAGTSGGINFDIQIPAQPVGAIVDYYFISYDYAGNPATTFPRGYNTYFSQNQVTLPYQFGVGITPAGLGWNFETVDTNWTIGNATGDNATSGKWIQAVPIPAYWKPSNLSFMSQTDKDHTSGTGKCLVTGNGTSASVNYNTADVDNGRTSVISPLLDLTGMIYPIIEYYRWYSNDLGGANSNPRTDMFQVQVRDQNSNIWKSVDATFQADQSWRRRIFALFDYLPVSKYVYIRFIAADDVFSTLVSNGQGNIEAAVDDIMVYDIFPTSVGTKPTPAKLQIYPNPANATLTVSMSKSSNGIISIADFTGRTLITQETTEGTTVYTFNTASLAAGQYMLMIKANGTIQVHKIAIVH